MDRATLCQKVLVGFPDELLVDPWFKVLLATLAQQGILGDEIGMRETGWVIARMMARYLNLAV